MTGRRRACPSPRRSPTLPIAWAGSSGSRGSLKTDAKPHLTQLTIHELVDAYRAGSTTPTAATEAYLARIAAHDDKVGGYLTVTREEALAQAHAADERYRKDRKSTRLNSSHLGISYAVFCLKKK